MDTLLIREIQPEDNAGIAALIRTVLIEYNVPKVGTAYADPQLDCMYETYNIPGASYFIAFLNGIMVGGSGIMKLAGQADTVCELQKMYFDKNARGRGIGKKMMQKCLQQAGDFGYSHCYLETMPYMQDAQKLYLTSGFDYIHAPMGNTGHSACPVWMLKKL